MGRFIPTVMPFGPKGAPSVFGAAMQKILETYILQDGLHNILMI